MLNILIDNTNRSQIYAAQDEYFELVKYMISLEPEGSFKYKYESL
jgi:hypothetical protein